MRSIVYVKCGRCGTYYYARSKARAQDSLDRLNAILSRHKMVAKFADVGVVENCTKCNEPLTNGVPMRELPEGAPIPHNQCVFDETDNLVAQAAVTMGAN